MEPRDLSERGFRFLKVPAQVLLRSAPCRQRATSIAADLSDLLARYRHRPDRRADREREHRWSICSISTCASARASCSRRRGRCAPRRCRLTRRCDKGGSAARHAGQRPTARLRMRRAAATTCRGASFPSISPMASCPALRLHRDHCGRSLADYDAVLCDVWGVVHNGVRRRRQACDALMRVPRQGRDGDPLITNAPRPGAASWYRSSTSFTCRARAYDGIVTSGDVTRARDHGAAGPERLPSSARRATCRSSKGSICSFAGRSRAADYVVCSGLVDDKAKRRKTTAPCSSRCWRANCS